MVKCSAIGCEYDAMWIFVWGCITCLHVRDAMYCWRCENSAGQNIGAKLITCVNCGTPIEDFLSLRLTL